MFECELNKQANLIRIKIILNVQCYVCSRVVHLACCQCVVFSALWHWGEASLPKSRKSSSCCKTLLTSRCCSTQFNVCLWCQASGCLSKQICHCHRTSLPLGRLEWFCRLQMSYGYSARWWRQWGSVALASVCHVWQFQFKFMAYSTLVALGMLQVDINAPATGAFLGCW